MDNNTTMKQLFDEFNKANKQLDEMSYLFNTMSRNLDANNKVETVTCKADDKDIVYSYTHTVQSPGAYKIITKGKGKASFAVKDSSGLIEVTRDVFDDDAESEEFVLGNRDEVFLHASADAGFEESITLVQTKSLFELMDARLKSLKTGMEVVNNRIDNLVSEYSVTAMVDEDNETLVLKSSAEALE